MADTEKKISELDSAAQINTDDITVLSQGNSGTGFASVKATILAIANKIVSGINFSSALQTEDKTITGAINEVAQGGGGGGASELDDLDDVSISSPTNGQVLKYNSTSQEWENANESGGGSGGHTILDNDGTALAQEDDLQFAGTYSEDDSTNGKTVVNITREMTQADYDLLSADKKKGIIRITDNNYVCDATEASFDKTGTSFTSDDVDGVLREVNTALSKPIGYKAVWTGSAYNVNDEIEIADFSTLKLYMFVFRGFSSANVLQFVTIPFENLQFIIQGETSQYVRYRMLLQANLKYKIIDKYGTGDANAGLINIYEIVK